MTTATTISRGRITIPASVRAALHIKVGDRIEFVEIQAGRYELIAVNRSVTALKGMFGKPKHAVSIKSMKAATTRRRGSAR